MGVTVQLLHSADTVSRMAVISAMMVGTVAGVAVLASTLMSIARRNDQHPRKRQRASVTEVLQVDMVDRGLCFTATNIDCHIDIEIKRPSMGWGSADQVLVPAYGGFVEVLP